jgi:hypothetical protein
MPSHLPVVLHYAHEGLSSSVDKQGYVAPAAQPLLEFGGSTEALDKEQGGGGHPVRTSK